MIGAIGAWQLLAILGSTVVGCGGKKSVHTLPYRHLSFLFKTTTNYHHNLELTLVIIVKSSCVVYFL